MGTSRLVRVFVITMLIATVLAIPPIGEVTGQTLYVGGAGGGNYTSIQSAIDNASAGDTVFIYKAKYVESVIVDKPITIRGESTEVEIGDLLENYAIMVESSNVSILNISVSTLGLDAIYAEGVEDLFISGMVVTYSHRGVHLKHSNRTTIQDSTFANNTAEGVRVDGSENVTIQDCSINWNEENGVRLSNSYNCTIRNNNIDYTTASSNIAITDGGDHIIENNQIEYSLDDHGVLVRHSDRNTFHNNTISLNYDDGIRLVTTNDTIITDNTFYYNRLAGVQTNQGCNQTTISHNDLSYGKEGFNITLTNNTNITSNTVDGTTSSGLVLRSDVQAYVTKNTFSTNSLGMNVYNTTGGSFYGNYFIDNDADATDNGNNSWNATYPAGGNYWSNHTGTDTKWGEAQDIPGSDNVWDTPLNIPGGNNSDRHPVLDKDNWISLPVPELVSLSPTDEDFNIAVSTNLTMVFSQPIDTATPPTLIQSEGTQVNYTFAGLSKTNIDNDTITWTHDLWDTNDRIKLDISNITGLYDVASPDVPWWFDTEDTIAPIPWGFNPANGSANVQIDQQVRVLFTERMKDTAPILRQTGGSGVAYTFVGWEELQNEGDTAVWVHPDWNEIDTITLELSGAQDLTGNPINETIVWEFSTGGGATATGPSSGATANTPVITYTWNGDPLEIHLFYTSDGGETWYLAGKDKTVDGSFAWTPAKPGTYGWSAVSFPSGGEPGEPLSGTPIEAGPYIFDATPPTIEARSPEGTSPSRENVEVVFSETMATYYIPELAQLSGQPVPYYFTGWESTNQPYDTATWSHDPWTVGDSVSLSISGYRDLTGNVGDLQYWTILTYADQISPIAVAGDDKTVSIGDLVTFNASGSTDNVGISTYTWNFTYLDMPFTVNGETTDFIFSKPGEYIITLTVLDVSNNQATDTMKIIVSDMPQDGRLVGTLLLSNITLARTEVIVYPANGSEIRAITGFDGRFNISIPPGAFRWETTLKDNYASGSGSMSPGGQLDLGNVSLDGSPPIQVKEDTETISPLVWMLPITVIALACILVVLLVKRRRSIS